MIQPVVPFRQFVLKVHSRCDLACDHCYVYQSADQSWRDRPMVMPVETAVWAAQRIGEHAKSHQLRRVRVVLHGGEPLLAGAPRLQQIAESLRAALTGVSELDLRIHTNGVLLDDAFCELFAAHSVQVGFSIDGDRAANDRHRRYADGRSSYDSVVRAIGLLRADAYRHLYAGLLCTVDVRNDPLTVYESLVALRPPRVDFLLPHATWDRPPYRPPGAPAAYADWLIAIFDRWEAQGRPVGIRLFDSIIGIVQGTGSLTEALGTAPSDLMVIEADGAYEQADSLKVAYDGAPATGFDVFRHSLDEAAGHPEVIARQKGIAGLCETCRRCAVVATCGGGLFAHRYRSGSGFANPSVYCADLMKLINHVSATMPPALQASPASHPAHALATADLDQLASGYGGGVTVTRLGQAQRSLMRALVAAVCQAASDASWLGDHALDLKATWALLESVDREDPQVLGDVLAHPYVRVWATRCLERLQRGPGSGPHRAEPPGFDLGYLAGVAMAAAIRSGTDGVAMVPVRNGSIHLPTLGHLVLNGSGPGGKARVTNGADGAVTVELGQMRWRAEARSANAQTPADGLAFEDTRTADWQPVRRLAAAGFSVGLEDTDPYRDCHRWTAEPRLSGPQHAEWAQRFRDAWDLIRHEHGAYAPGMAAGLTTVMPLSALAEDREVSATARDAFGAVAVALPASPAILALLLIHEFQHLKLGAVLDMYDLYDETDIRLFPAPWREDPRPLEGLLQGTYAHVAVTDFWRIRRHCVSGPDAERAARRFAHWRAHTASAIETLADTGSLTPLGVRFVDGMRETVAPWLDEPIAEIGGSAPSAMGVP
jgi:uncharacterized protein